VSQVIPFPLIEENKHVKDLAEFLNKNGMKNEAQGLSEIFNHVCSMERDLEKAVGELTAMRQELSVMRDEQNHPIKTMLHKAADGLMAQLKSLLKLIVALKDKIIGMCKQTVEAVKDQGIIAANGIVSALNIKDDLESARNRINVVIGYNEKKIANIEAAAAEYHTAGRAIKNLGRIFVGKEPIPDIKPNGKLAKLLKAPFNIEIKSLKRSLARTDKALGIVNKLEKAAEQRIERSRPSVLDEMKRHKVEKSQPQLEVTVAKKTKTAGQEL